MMVACPNPVPVPVSVVMTMLAKITKITKMVSTKVVRLTLLALGFVRSYHQFLHS
jgi:hypothetical protein